MTIERQKVQLDDFEDYLAAKLREIGSEMSGKVIQKGGLGQLKQGSCFIRRADFELQGVNIRVVVLLGEEKD